MSDYHLSETEYSALPLSADVQYGIQEAGFKYCTPIQALTLPLALAGKDISGQAQTGTGKTAAFLIATLETLGKNSQAAKLQSSQQAQLPQTQEKTLEKKESKPKKKAKNAIRAIMIAPTRELAKQIYDDATPLNKKTNYKIALAYGGTDYEKQRDAIEQGCDILIGTPGRIIDYFKQKVFSLKELEVLVMDEADRMFDMGFIDDIRYLLRGMPEPKERQSLLFSATMSQRVKELAYENMNSPETIVVEAEQVTADKIEQIGFMPANEEKIPLTLGILKDNAESKSIIFINTKHQGEKIQRWLEVNDFKSGLLSGDVPQKKRERLLQQFKEGKINNLVATDVAARGLHIDGVDTVINFDLPNDAEDYVHRIGRTARAGASGKAISLICETFGMNIMDIESYIDHKIPIKKDYSDFLLSELNEPKPIARTRKGNSDRKPSAGSKNSTDSKNSVAAKSNTKKNVRNSNVFNSSVSNNNTEKIINRKTQDNSVTVDTNPDQQVGEHDNYNHNRYMRRSNNLKEIPAIG